MDDTDRKMLRALQGDGRMTNADLARAVNLSESACLRRLRALE
ncbi:MAG: AsnC family transcriptional regulator, partial [Rubrivivax sp.]